MKLDDYVVNNSIYSFSQKPFNEIDNLVFSSLPYLSWDEILTKKNMTLKVAGDKYFQMYESEMNVISVENGLKRRKILSLIFNSRRYSSITLMDYENIFDEEKQMQFGAMTIKIASNLYYVVFKGTDDKIISYKEDFDMSYKIVASQQKACEYLKRQLRHRGKFIVGGHSKGGNLATYAAMMNNTDRISIIYNNDGPGFTDNIVKTEQYQNITSKLVHMIPGGSIVGMLMYHGVEPIIVKCDEKSKLSQHNPLNWNVTATGLEMTTEQSKTSRFIRDSINPAFMELSEKDRAVVIDSVYQVLLDMNIITINDIDNKQAQIIRELLRRFKQINLDTDSDLVAVAMKALQKSEFNFLDKIRFKAIADDKNEQVKDEETNSEE